MSILVWRHWALPKCKLFIWLVTENRIWTADKLERRGWDNCGRCNLRNQVQDTAAYLFFQCRFTTRFWKAVKVWLGIHDIQPVDWNAVATMKDWWTNIINAKGQNSKALVSLVMLISWEIWIEMSARVFRNHASLLDRKSVV